MDSTHPRLPNRDAKPDPDALLISRYEIVEELGRGGMGSVYRARHKVLGVEVAIKIIRSDWDSSRFRREAKILAKIKSPNVVAVRDYEVLSNGVPMLVMDWVDGADLSVKMHESGGCLDEDQVLSWMKQTCDGMLAAAHQGIVHRDLKPPNIIIDSRNQARVADFGLARGFQGAGEMTLSRESMGGDVMGTPYYMSPEQAEDPQRVDTRSDIYSFGATFYHALTGHPPFDGNTPFSILFKHKSEPVASPRARNTELSENTSQILERCLAKSPSDRFQSFDEISKYLESTALDSSPWDELHDKELAAYLTPYRTRRSEYLNRQRAMDVPDEYRLPGDRLVKIMVANLEDQEVDVIVSSDRASLDMREGIAAAIRHAAGTQVEQEARIYRRVRPGRAVVTSAGELKADLIFHGITSDESEQLLTPSRDVISEIMKSCFYHANSLHVKSIAFPLLGASAGDFPQGAFFDPSFRMVYNDAVSQEICLDTMFRFLIRNLQRGVTSIREARIILSPMDNERTV